ncbi:protein FAM107B isoform X1 [Hirundo rustica]|uniref:protein FAM107B isoform X1 n=1 Tax=Hirundo rustica TaxID=43150 RepID=UPI00267331C6|nr:protein FAM107B isoform X1 [Hirundo rustica]
MEEKKTEAAPAVCLQPSTAAASSIKHGGERDGEEMFKGSRRSDKQSRASSSSSNHTAAQAVPATTQPSVFAAKELSQEVIALCTHIPRPSIIHVPKEEEDEEEESPKKQLDLPVLEYESLSDTVNKDPEPKDPFPIPRKIMAEPDYIDDDNPELIRPQKLINPVKSSRNHQDLHRELLMNQKRGLAPQNKPELQKVMEKRKRDQVIKQQKEEEAQKKKSDLEIELLKRQQKLEQLELEKQKIQEEQENAPEFVKVKGNLRRTVQEATEAPDS